MNDWSELSGRHTGLTLWENGTGLSSFSNAKSPEFAGTLCHIGYTIAYKRIQNLPTLIHGKKCSCQTIFLKKLHLPLSHVL